MALEAAEQGITVNAICLGYVKIDLMDEQFTNFAVGKGVKTGEITAAVRPVTLNGVDVNTGTLIGLLEQQLVLADQDILNLVESLLRLAEVEDEHLVTLYHGSPVGIDEARIIEQHVQEAFPNTEVRLHEGAQPHYHFVVSVE